MRNRYFHAHPRPAWTAVGAHMLGGAPGYIVEIKAVAVAVWSGEREGRDVGGRRLLVCTIARDAGQSRDGTEVAGTSGRDDAMSPFDCVTGSKAIGDGPE